MPSKYSALAKYLKQNNKEEIRLRFEEVEEIVGKLPPSAWKYPAWWSNSESHSNAKHGWLSAGWLTRKVDIEAKECVFIRQFTEDLNNGQMESQLGETREKRSVDLSKSDEVTIDEIVSSAGGIENLSKLAKAVDRYVYGEITGTELGRIIREVWPKCYK